MKNDIDLLFDLLRADGSIVINKKLARGIGIQPAIMYSELLSKYKYFADRNMLKDGWFFNSIENMRKDTCLSEYQQREAIGKLRELGLIAYKLNGMPATRYFKIVKSGKLYEILKAETAPQTRSEEIKELSLKNSRSYPKKLPGNNTNLNNTKHNHNDTGVSIEKKLYLDLIYLSDEEYKKLIDDYGKNKVDFYVEDLNRYIIEHDVSYKSHYLTIKAWIRKNTKESDNDISESDFVDLRKEIPGL